MPYLPTRDADLGIWVHRECKEKLASCDVRTSTQRAKRLPRCITDLRITKRQQNAKSNSIVYSASQASREHQMRKGKCAYVFVSTVGKGARKR